MEAEETRPSGIEWHEVGVYLLFFTVKTAIVFIVGYSILFSFAQYFAEKLPDICSVIQTNNDEIRLHRL